MNKFWRVVRYEYSRHVFRRRFLLGLLSVPAVILVMGLVLYLVLRSETKDTPVGYIDYSGLLANPLPAPEPQAPNRPVKLIRFEDEQQADAALQAGEIQAYYLLEDDYLSTNRTRRVSVDNPSESAEEQFISFVRVNLLANQPQAVSRRITEGTNMVVRTPDGKREMGEDEWLNVMMPFIAGLVLMIAIFSTSGYLVQAVVEEKENRTMEVLVTSVSPEQLMSGKVIGIIGVGLTQIIVWILFAAALVLVGRQMSELFRDLHFSISSALLLLIVFIPAFVTVAALMVILGVTVADGREAQQFSGLLTLAVVIPYWLALVIMSDPNGLPAVLLSFFPLTAPVTVSMRVMFTTIPTWQFILNMAVLILAAIGSLWLAGRAFRLGMLSYGKRVSLRKILGRRQVGEGME
jgi:ABC-2 type transport system permease protein